MKTRQYTWVALVNFLPPLLGYNIYLQIWGYQKNRNDREREKEIDEREREREREEENNSEGWKNCEDGKTEAMSKIRDF